MTEELSLEVKQDITKIVRKTFLTKGTAKAGMVWGSRSGQLKSVMRRMRGSIAGGRNGVRL